MTCTPDRIPRTPAIVLVVEDNPIARRLMRASLERPGRLVLLAADGREAIRLARDASPSLVLIDMLLPDMDGVELARLLRTLPGTRDSTFIAVSGLPQKLDEARSAGLGITHGLHKPVDPRALAAIVDAEFAARHPDTNRRFEGRLVLVDDDEVQCRLNAFQLRAVGFDVVTAHSGPECIARAREIRPVVIVLDLVMPGMNGLETAFALRTDPELAAIPIVLSSNTFASIGEDDRALARSAGISAFVERTPALEGVITAIGTSLQAALPPVEATCVSLADGYRARLTEQLQARLAQQAGAQRRIRLDSAIMSVLAGTSYALRARRPLGAVLREALVSVAEASGAPAGGVYTLRDGSLEALALVGTDGADPLVRVEAHVHEALERGVPVLTNIGEDAAPGDGTCIIAPLITAGQTLGVLLLWGGSTPFVDDWLELAATVSSQLAHCVALASTVERLDESERTHRWLFDASPLPLLEVDPRRLTIRRSNDSAAALYGCAASDLAGADLSSFALPRARDAFTAFLSRAREGATAASHFLHHNVRGDILELEVTAEQGLGAGGRVLLVGLRDVTASRRLERGLVAHKQVATMLATLTEPASVEVALVEILGSTLQWDTCRFWIAGDDMISCAVEWRRESGVRKSSLRYAPTSSVLPARALRTGELVTGVPQIRVAGEPRHSLGVAFPVFPVGQHAACIELDRCDGVTLSEDESHALRSIAALLATHIERESALRQLAREQHHLRSVVSAASAVLYSLQVTGDQVIATWNGDGLPALVGCEPGTSITHEQWKQAVNPEDLDRVLSQLDVALADGRSTIEYRLRPGPDRTIWVRDELRVISRRDDCAELVGVLSDITARRDLEQQLIQAQKMEATGLLAGGIAHDFNNLLTAILGYADLLLADIAETDERRADVEEIRATAKRAAVLTAQLLAFSRKQVLQMKPVDVNHTVGNLERMLTRVIGTSARIVLRLGAAPMVAITDEGQLEQVLVNLAINARDAMPDGGTITITTEAQPQAGTMSIQVQDTGTGMPPEVVERAFEPFFSTKPQGRGTGLGLSVVYGIIQQSHGSVLINSKPGAGTCISITLPTQNSDRPPGPQRVLQASPAVPTQLAC